MEVNNSLYYFSIKRLEDCLFSRRNGHKGIRLCGYSIFFKFKTKHGIY